MFGVRARRRPRRPPPAVAAQNAATARQGGRRRGEGYDGTVIAVSSKGKPGDGEGARGQTGEARVEVWETRERAETLLLSLMSGRGRGSPWAQGGRGRDRERNNSGARAASSGLGRRQAARRGGNNKKGW